MNKLNELVALCKASVTLTANQHKDYYQTVTDYLHELSQRESPPEIEADVLQEMIERDTIIELHFYPHTPIGFYLIYHYDLEKCIEEALEIVKRNQ